MEFRIYPISDDARGTSQEEYVLSPKTRINGANDMFYREIVLTNNCNYGLMSIDGIEPTDCTFNTSHLVGVNGERLNSSFINSRTITITVAINAPAEQNRKVLFNTCRINSLLGMEFRLDDKVLFIAGYVKQIPTTYFDKKEVCQIVVFCPEPEFKRINTFQYPRRRETLEMNGEALNLQTYGDLPTYPHFSCYFNHSATNFTINKSFSHYLSKQFMKIEYDFFVDFYMYIDCVPSYKRIDGSDGQSTENDINLLAYLTPNSSWIKFDDEYTGTNIQTEPHYIISAEDSTANTDGSEVVITFYDLYQGV